MTKRPDPPDDMLLKDWFATQSRDDWPSGAFVRASRLYSYRDSEIKTVGDLRARIDDKHLFHKFGLAKKTVNAIRTALGEPTRVKPPPPPPKVGGLAWHRERVAELERQVAELKAKLDGEDDVRGEQG